VRWQIVHDDDVASRERRRQKLLDIEHFRVARVQRF
jgi:hypothetical protein